MATPAPGGEKTSLGLEPNLAALLCYVPCCIGLVFSIVAAIVERQSRFVRFHAFQGLLVGGGVLAALGGLGALQWALALTGLGFVAALVGLVFWVVLIAATGITILLMVQAHSGLEFELPVIGPLVRQWV